MKIIFALLSLMLLILPTELQAQNTESDSSQETNKSFVSVPVTVSDREGRYIPGLKKEDFSVYQDGIKQKITFFSGFEPSAVVSFTSIVNCRQTSLMILVFYESKATIYCLECSQIWRYWILNT